MHIAFSADDKYAQHLGVSLASTLVNLKAGIVPHIYVLDNGIKDDNKEKIAALKSIRDFSIAYFKVDPKDFKDYPLTDEYPYAETYFRLKLPSLLPHVDKILYLDVDIVVDDDLYSLWETALSLDEWLGVIFEPDVYTTHTVTIGMQETEPYFNAGILLMNLAALRAIDFDALCRKFADDFRPTIKYPDQDMLNYICRNNLRALHPRYNLIGNFVNKAHKLDKVVSPYDVPTMENAIKNPAIVHFVGTRKPWFYKCYSPYGHKYMEYIKYTPWKEYCYPDKSVKNIISKFLHNRRQNRRAAQGK